MDLTKISDHLLAERSITHPLRLLRKVGGGCINDCFEVSSGKDVFFLKVNRADRYPHMFQREREGLQALRSAGALHIPEVFGTGTVSDTSYLWMEWVAAGKRSSDFWEAFGHGLAALHRHGNDHFGFPTDNYIGSLPQQNAFLGSWPLFYLERRLIPQLELGTSAGWASSNCYRQAERLVRTMESDHPAEVPALLHGDLWSGNFMVGKDGSAVLVDPAVYYGNREVEMAFTMLFGGFHEAFYEAYHSAFPLAPDLNGRLEIHQLYPLMVHANLFGGHYVQNVLSTLRQF